jgi:diguanylate cyclase (GGDEF)-like protein/PAS domain S-box-containing protein
MLGMTVITGLAAVRLWVGFNDEHRAERAEIEAAASRHAATIAAVSADNLHERLAGFDQTLRQLAAAYATHRRVPLEALRAARLSQPPGLVLNFVRVDARGYVREGERDADARIYVGDLPFFQYHASNPGESLRVDPPTISRLLNRWAIPVSRVLRDAEGRFAGLVLLGLSPEQLSTGFRSLELGATDVIAVIHADGSYLARSYRLSEALGQKVRGDRVYLRGDAPLAGSFRGQGTVDGIDRVWAYQRLPGFDISVVVGLDLSGPMQPMLDRHGRERENMFLATTMALALLAALLALLWRLDHSLRDLRGSEERLKMALEGASEVAWDWRAGSNQVTLLGNCRLFLGVQVPSIELDLPSWRERVHIADRPAVRAAWIDHLEGRTAEFEAEYRVLGGENTYRWVLARGATEQRDATGKAQRVTGVLIDIDPIKRAQLTISRLSARYQQLFASANEGIYVIDALGEIEMMNTAAQRLTGWREEEVRGKQAHTLFHEALAGHPDHSWATCPLNLAMKTGEVRDRERLVYWRKDGSAMPVELSIGPLKQGDEGDGAIVVFSDITERLATERQLETLATTDELTGLANRRRFVEIAERDLKRAAREGTPATLIMMDLDHFKSVNDRFGHAMGDCVLKAVTGACATQLRAVDIFGRLGGEEFAVLLANIDPARAIEVAERMRLAASEREIRDGDRTVTVTVSLGVAHAGAGETLDSLLARADSALYSAKEGGRNRVLVAESSPTG